ncbi:MAG TPA: HEAT repeat domain-containing protein, partial [Kofleriaceae bacterium]|nr:HEAT repeat domain-containing protein [Kofleriaceae bacterium]
VLRQRGGEVADSASAQIARLLGEDGPPEERAVALGLLGNLGDPRAAGALRRAIDDADPKIATAAIYDAQGSAGSQLEPQLLARILDPGAPPEVRSAAAQVLRQRGGEVADSASAQIARLLGEDGPAGK